MPRMLLAAAVLAALMCFGSGCLIVTGSRMEETGVKISGATLSQVTPGETTEAWLLAALGQPTERRTVDERTSILRYEYTLTTSKGGAVFLLFAGGDQKQETTATMFEITDGVVTRYWTEH